MPRGRRKKVDEEIQQNADVTELTESAEEATVEEATVEEATVEEHKVSDKPEKEEVPEEVSEEFVCEECKIDESAVAEPEVAVIEQDAKLTEPEPVEATSEKPKEAKPKARNKSKSKKELVENTFIASSPLPLYTTPSSQIPSLAVSGVVRVIESSDNWKYVEATVSGLGKITGYIKA